MTPMPRFPAVRRGLVAAALVPLAFTSFTACSGGDDKATDSPSSSSSPSDSSSPSPTPEPSAGTVGEGDSVAAADFVDLVEAGFENTTTAHETMKMALGATGDMSGEGDVDFRTTPPSMAMTMAIPALGGEMEMRLVDSAFYMSIEGMTDGKFIKMDLNDPNSPLGALGNQLDPREAFKSFEQGIDSVMFVGQEDVHGASLAHYTATVDTAEMMKALGQGVPAAAGLPDKLDYDVWLDDMSRLNRMDIEMGTLGTMEMSLSAFGQDVSIEAPAADQITEMPAVGG